MVQNILSVQFKIVFFSISLMVPLLLHMQQLNGLYFLHSFVIKIPSNTFLTSGWKDGMNIFQSFSRSAKQSSQHWSSSHCWASPTFSSSSTRRSWREPRTSTSTCWSTPSSSHPRSHILWSFLRVKIYFSGYIDVTFVLFLQFWSSKNHQKVIQEKPH